GGERPIRRHRDQRSAIVEKARRKRRGHVFQGFSVQPKAEWPPIEGLVEVQRETPLRYVCLPSSVEQLVTPRPLLRRRPALEQHPTEIRATTLRQHCRAADLWKVDVSTFAGRRFGRQCDHCL